MTIRITASTFAALLLAGCGGTVVEMDGQICGQPVKLRMADQKDRSGFDLAIVCGPEGSIALTTSDSSASAVIQAQATAIAGLAAAAARVAP